jgi:hypothetical protein
METKFIYDLILPYFLGNDDMRPVTKKVHKDKDGYLYATEGHIAIRIPHEKVMNSYEEVSGFPSAGEFIRNTIGREDNIKATILTNNLIRVLSYLQWRRVMAGDSCEECFGTGTINCEHCGSDYKCGECKGTGTVNMRIKELVLLQNCDDFYSVKIGTPAYKANFLYIIAITAQMLHAASNRT